MTDFGSGPKLNRDLDFEVTTTGDLSYVRGLQELEKDVALQSLIRLSVFEGATQTVQNKSKIRDQVNSILLSDPRIDQVLSIDITFLEYDNSVEIVSEVSSDNTEQELVFEV